MKNYLLGGVLSPTFDAFGCQARGAHLNDQERSGCFPCAVERGDVDQALVSLDDDRGAVTPVETDEPESWPHTRFFKPGVGLHRADGPAIESEHFRAWFIDGVPHRDDGPALEWDENHFAYFEHGKLHRLDGAAVEHDEGWQWRRHGLLHRADGPAVFTHGNAFNSRFRATADRYEHALDGHVVSREQAWGQWVADQSAIETSNTGAVDFLDRTINGATPGHGPFGVLDETTVMLALALHINPVTSATTSIALTPEIDHSDQGDSFKPAVAWHEDWEVLSPEALLPPASSRQPVAYDAKEFRRRIEEADCLGTLRVDTLPLGEVWPRTESGYGWKRAGDYVAADLEIDADMLAFGMDRHSAHTIFDDRRIQAAREVGDLLPLATRRFWLATTARDSARELVAVVREHGSVSSLADRLAPDESIICPIERAFEFAAQAISVGVDDIVARSWATAIVVAAGYPRVPLRWAREVPAGESSQRIIPTRSVSTDYYAQALRDLRDGQDATRFMDYVARCYRWPSSAALTDG